MPTFVLHGSLVHYAGSEHHVGLYGARAMKLEGARDVPDREGLPAVRARSAKVISQLVSMRVAENLEKASSKKKKRPRPAR